jgi:hypothetical protein
MLSFFDRRKRLHLGPFSTPSGTDIEEMARMRVIEEKAYTKKMQDMWKELKEQADDGKRVDYWGFIGTQDFSHTIARAQLVSFLVSYGYANLLKTSRGMFLVPKDKPDHLEGSPLSFPIPITKEALERAK